MKVVYPRIPSLALFMMKSLALTIGVFVGLSIPPIDFLHGLSHLPYIFCLTYTQGVADTQLVCTPLSSKCCQQTVICFQAAIDLHNPLPTCQNIDEGILQLLQRTVGYSFLFDFHLLPIISQRPICCLPSPRHDRQAGSWRVSDRILHSDDPPFVIFCYLHFY